jgi:uncharacterized protein YceH (UPF0502 family)
MYTEEQEVLFMPDNADPITPEDRPATLRDVTTAIATAKRETVEELTEVMRDMQTEILKGLQAFAKGNFTRFHTVESTQSDINIRMAALEERVLYLETRRPPQ